MSFDAELRAIRKQTPDFIFIDSECKNLYIPVFCTQTHT